MGVDMSKADELRAAVTGSNGIDLPNGTLLIEAANELERLQAIEKAANVWMIEDPIGQAMNWPNAKKLRNLLGENK